MIPVFLPLLLLSVIQVILQDKHRGQLIHHPAAPAAAEVRL
jgi:hypothetical protein